MIYYINEKTNSIEVKLSGSNYGPVIYAFVHNKGNIINNVKKYEGIIDNNIDNNSILNKHKIILFIFMTLIFIFHCKSLKVALSQTNLVIFLTKKK